MWNFEGGGYVSPFKLGRRKIHNRRRCEGLLNPSSLANPVTATIAFKPTITPRSGHNFWPTVKFSTGLLPPPQGHQGRDTA